MPAPSLIIISSPSGAGKSTLCKMLISRNDNIKLSISATTRQARPSEIHGREYFFLSEKEFAKMQKNGEFLEDAQVFNNFYGTPKKMVEDETKKGNLVLFDIDWQGARQIFSKYSAEKIATKIISFFILPPSLTELEKRLSNRAEDSTEVVKSRMQKAQDEITHWCEYDHILVNEDLEETYAAIHQAIFAGDFSKIPDKIKIRQFVNQLI